MRAGLHDSSRAWALNAFLVAMHAGFALTAWTTVGVLSWSDGAVVALDLWLLVMVGLTVWGIQALPAGVRRLRFERQLAYLELIWIAMGFWTALEIMNSRDFGVLVLVGGGGVAGFLYADRLGSLILMRVSALAFILALWVWAWDIAGPIGGVASLAVTAGLLFWLSGRRGHDQATDSSGV